MRTAILTSLFLLTCSFAAMPAMAQPLNPLGGTAGQAGGVMPPPQDKKPAIPLPDAVPGAKTRPDSVAPATRTMTDLPPTEALFDSINRGDIADARDAINRGADLDSTNLLGLTPIELSVDLGRNDISFLLLSLRGGSRSGSAQAAVQPAPAPTPHTAAERRAATRAASRGTTPVTATATREVRAQPQAPTLFAGDGGTAIPSAGFLGFGPRQ